MATESGATPSTPSGAADRVFLRLVRTDRVDPSSLPEAAQPYVSRNGLRHIGANTLQGIGDQVVNAKTVLPWLLTALGAPGVLLAMLVPVREAGSMLPQAVVSPWVERHPVRKWVWIAGGVGQALAAGAMALVAATTSGTVAGAGILAALAVLALARSLTSLSGKDVLGRTIPKGERGQVNGIVTVGAGAVALALGLSLRWLGPGHLGVGLLAGLLAAAALAWLAAVLVYSTIAEPTDPEATAPVDVGDGAAAGATGTSRWLPGSWARSWSLLHGDRVFRRFVMVRTLLLVSALSPPFVVALAAGIEGVGLGGLGLFVIAQGLASMAGGRLFGRWADRSSRTLMACGSAAASVVVLAFLAVRLLPGARDWVWLYPTAYLLLALVHVGARVARKTYVVDIAEGDRRTEYVAVSNSAMGVLLLLVGALTGALATLGSEPALLLLAALGLLGAVLGRSLPEVGSR